MESIRCAIIGGSLDGKTFLAAGFSRGLYKNDGIASLVFDPYRGETDWGTQALVFGPDDFEKWRRAVTNVRPEQKFAAIWDEGTHTGGDDKKNTKLVTAIRHNCPAFIYIGHGYSTLRPIMRGSLTHVCLAARDPEDAKEWARVMVDADVMRAAEPAPPRGNGLRQYEFLKKRKHRPVEILRYSKAEILAGIQL